MTQLPGEHGLVSITPTHGIDQILVTFGDIFAYIREDHILDPRWQAEHCYDTSSVSPATLLGPFAPG